MTTDFTNNGKTISTTGGFKPDTRNTPLDARTVVELKADIDTIPNPFVGMHIVVKADETNDNKMTEYVVKSLKANTLGVADSKVNEVVLAKDFLGVSANGMTQEQVSQLSTAYQHSQAIHAPSNAEANVQADWNETNTASDAYIKNKPTNLATTDDIPTVPTNVSAFTNDANYASETFVTNKIAEAQLGGGSGTVDLSGYVTKETGNANQITFADGQTFQAKLEAGTLKGEKGDKGDKGDTGQQGPQGPAGQNGADGLTTAISVNGNTYTHVDGVITLPNYPSNTGGGTTTDDIATDEEVSTALNSIFGGAN